MARIYDSKKKTYNDTYLIALVGTLIGDIQIMNMTYSDYVSNQAGGLSTGVDIAFSGVCTLICGVIAAIPLMVSGSGMDDSKLFG